MEEVSLNPGLLQYLAPIIPDDELLFKHGVLAQAGMTCNAPQLAFCQKQFADALGQTADIFTDPVKFSKLIHSYYQKTAEEGLLKLCPAQLVYRNCLGYFYTACTDAFNIFSKQVPDLNSAFLLAGVYDDIEFDCGGGFTQGLLNWPCINAVNKNSLYDQAMKNCATNYNDTVRQDPRAYCKAGQDLATCIGQAYKTLDKCTNNNVQWWACERMDRRVKLEGYCDANNCADVFAPAPSNQDTKKETFQEFIQRGGFVTDGHRAFFKQLVKKYRKMAAAGQI